MFTLLMTIYAIGAIALFFGCIISGTQEDETPLRLIGDAVFVAVIWPGAVAGLVLFLIWWGIVGD
jgi:hypothetical protein